MLLSRTVGGPETGQGLTRGRRVVNKKRNNIWSLPVFSGHSMACGICHSYGQLYFYDSCMYM